METADFGSLAPHADFEKRAAGRTRRFSKADRSEKQTTFLDAFAASGIILVGCRAAGITRQLVDYWNEHDSDFSNRYGFARREADDRIRAEIQRRAMQGVTRSKPIFYKGVQVGSDVYVEYSDALLILLAKARMPEFRERNLGEDEGKGKDGSSGISALDELRNRRASRAAS